MITEEGKGEFAMTDTVSKDILDNTVPANDQLKGAAGACFFGDMDEMKALGLSSITAFRSIRKTRG